MPFHEITARGKKWICLTDISSKADESLYEHGKVLYERLFTEVEKEDYQNFRHYLADTAVERLRPDRAETIDTLFLALEEKSGQPKGFLYSSWYPPLGLVFVPYVGFLDNRSPQFFAGVPEVITKEREYVGLAGKPIEAVLFELETFDPLHLAPSSIRAMWTPDQKTANKRAQLTRVYQGKGGAWLIPWVTYRQPPLRKRGRPYDMHLMYWPTDIDRQRDPGEFSTEDIERLVRFAYQDFYLDGYLSTEPGKDHAYWKRLMARYSDEALRNVPARTRLDKVSTDRVAEAVFISYADPDLDKAQLVSMRLRNRGTPVFMWATGAKQQGGRRVGEVIEGWMRQASHFVFLLTEHSLAARGQQKEIALVRSGYPHAKVQIITDLEHGRLETTGFEVTGWAGTIYHRYADAITFPEAVDDCVGSIMNT